MPTIATADFIKAHGGEPVSDGRDCLLLPDGASIRNGATALFDTLYDPPADPRRRLRLRLAYHQQRYDQAAHAQRHFWAVCAGTAAERFAWSAELGTPPEAWGRLLRSGYANDDQVRQAEAAVKGRLAEIVIERRKALDAVLKEMAESPSLAPL